MSRWGPGLIAAACCVAGAVLALPGCVRTPDGLTHRDAARADALASDAAVAPDGRPIDAMVDAMVDARADAPPPPCALAPLTLAVATLAGCSDEGTADGTRAFARFANPVNVLVAPDGTAYVADFDSSRLRAVAADGTTMTVLAAPLARPFGLALAADGTLIVETDGDDTGHVTTETGTLWRVDRTTWLPTVIARGLGRPRGLAVLPDGRIVTSDYVHHVLAILDPATATVAPLAGARDVAAHANATSGGAARFAAPYDVVLDGDRVIVADRDNHRLRAIALADGATTDFAGSGIAGSTDGPLDTATFEAPQGLAVGPDGSIYVTDVVARRVRRIKDGVVTTIAGDGVGGSIDNADPLMARFYGLEGMAITPDGTQLVIADGNQGDGTPQHRVRIVRLP